VYNFLTRNTSYKKKFTEEQIIKVLEEGRTWIKIEELCRKFGISAPSYYKWKQKFGDMVVSDAKRLKSLEQENAKLKRLVAEQALDIVALKDVVSRKW
jgi:putative transposase